MAEGEDSIFKVPFVLIIRRADEGGEVGPAFRRSFALDELEDNEEDGVETSAPDAFPAYSLKGVTVVAFHELLFHDELSRRENLCDDYQDNSPERLMSSRSVLTVRRKIMRVNFTRESHQQKSGNNHKQGQVVVPV